MSDWQTWIEPEPHETMGDIAAKLEMKQGQTIQLHHEAMGGDGYASGRFIRVEGDYLVLGGGFSYYPIAGLEKIRNTCK